MRDSEVFAEDGIDGQNVDIADASNAVSDANPGNVSFSLWSLDEEEPEHARRRQPMGQRVGLLVRACHP
jgi:hypothetical protein